MVLKILLTPVLFPAFCDQDHAESSIAAATAKMALEHLRRSRGNIGTREVGDGDTHHLNPAEVKAEALDWLCLNVRAKAVYYL